MPYQPPPPPAVKGARRPPTKEPDAFRLLLESYSIGCTLCGAVFLALGLSTAVPAMLLQAQLHPLQVVDFYSLISSLYLIGFTFMSTSLLLFAAGFGLGIWSKKV